MPILGWVILSKLKGNIMSKYIFDIEANGLLNKITKIYMVVFKEVNEQSFIIFTDDDPKYRPLSEMSEWVKANVTTLIAHNGVRYDIPAMRKILGYELPDTINIVDTLIMSRMNNWVNSKMKGKHSLEAWGNFLGIPKWVFKDFSGGYSEEMLEYCKQDCRVNEAVYHHTINEFRAWSNKYPAYKQAMRMEHSMAADVAKQTENGWLFDFNKCNKLIDVITEKMKHIEEAVEPHLSKVISTIDKEPKTAKYKKNGEYTLSSSRVLSEYLGTIIYPEDALKEEPPIKPGETFQRIKVSIAGMGQQDKVKEYLEKLGIKWTQWNWKNIDGNFIKTGPKLNDRDILAIKHPHADMIADYYTLRSRRSILQGWMQQSEGDGRLRGDVMDLGTATGRHSHKVIANIPNGNAVLGKEIRELFICPEDKTLISADGASYQIRILAHYLKDEGYTDTVLNGDAHQRHADIAGVPRKTAKPLFFAIIFGAGGEKCAGIIGGNKKQGNAIRNKLISGIPNFENLIVKVQDAAKLNGWIPGIDGRKVYSPEPYKAVNYLIQSCEAILMKNTITAINQSFKDNAIEAKQLLMYHDECTWEINPEDTERAEVIIKHHFREEPKKFGVDIMEAGDVLIGKDYYEIH